MKEVRVSAAIIKRDDEVFATARGYGQFKGLWEFPGGKIEQGETPEEALSREIVEELGTKIKVDKLFEIVEYDYSDFHLVMYCYFCEIVEGDLELKEALEAKWLKVEDISSVNWLPADLSIIEKVKAELRKS